MGVLESLILGLMAMGWVGLTAVFALEVRRQQQEERDSRKKK